jgi:REP element-mobilizing transposase RayT
VDEEINTTPTLATSPESADDFFADMKLPWEAEEGVEKAATVDEPVSLEAIPPSEVATSPVVIEEKPAAPLDLEHFRFNYTCILVPANRGQFLARDLSERISSILPQFHLSQGWRLTSITLRPQYLLWTVSVPFGVCPHQLIRDVRKNTSEHIFANFPDLAREEGVGDFWSNDFLVVSGSEPPPVNLLFDFIAKALKTPEAALT